MADAPSTAAAGRCVLECYDYVEHIFSFAAFKSLVACSQVCATWRHVSEPRRYATRLSREWEGIDLLPAKVLSCRPRELSDGIQACMTGSLTSSSLGTGDACSDDLFFVELRTERLTLCKQVVSLGEGRSLKIAAPACMHKCFWQQVEAGLDPCPMEAWLAEELRLRCTLLAYRPCDQQLMALLVDAPCSKPSKPSADEGVGHSGVEFVGNGGTKAAGSSAPSLSLSYEPVEAYMHEDSSVYFPSQMVLSGTGFLSLGLTFPDGRTSP